MKSFKHFRAALALTAGAAAFFVAGCHTQQTSVSAPIAPNWYDSYYYKSGTLSFPNVPDTYSIASPGNPSNQ